MLLTTTQAAEMLNVTQRMIRAYCQDGRLKATKVGRDWLIEESDLDQLKRRKYQKKPKSQP